MPVSVLNQRDVVTRLLGVPLNVRHDLRVRAQPGECEGAIMLDSCPYATTTDYAPLPGESTLDRPVGDARRTTRAPPACQDRQGIPGPAPGVLSPRARATGACLPRGGSGPSPCAADSPWRPSRPRPRQSPAGIRRSTLRRGLRLRRVQSLTRPGGRRRSPQGRTTPPRGGGSYLIRRASMVAIWRLANSSVKNHC
jgi:hypothetical protein